jgi:hypothetical protein
MKNEQIAICCPHCRAHVFIGLLVDSYVAPDDSPLIQTQPSQKQYSQSAPMPGNPGNSNVVCKFCGGAVWNNTTKKLSPRSPDYKCRNNNCNAAAWIRNGNLSWSKK